MLPSGWRSSQNGSTGPVPRQTSAVGNRLRTFWKLHRLNGGKSQFSSVGRFSGGGGNPCMMPSSRAVLGFGGETGVFIGSTAEKDRRGVMSGAAPRSPYCFSRVQILL